MEKEVSHLHNQAESRAAAGPSFFRTAVLYAAEENVLGEITEDVRRVLFFKRFLDKWSSVVLQPIFPVLRKPSNE